MIMVHDGDVDDDDDDDGDELAGRQAATETDRQTGRRVAPVGAVWYQRLKLKHTRELHRFFMPDLTRHTARAAQEQQSSPSLLATYKYIPGLPTHYVDSSY